MWSRDAHTWIISLLLSWSVNDMCSTRTCYQLRHVGKPEVLLRDQVDLALRQQSLPARATSLGSPGLLWSGGDRQLRVATRHPYSSCTRSLQKYLWSWGSWYQRGLLQWRICFVPVWHMWKSYCNKTRSRAYRTYAHLWTVRWTHL